MVVLCSERDTQPIVNAGTQHQTTWNRAGFAGSRALGLPVVALHRDGWRGPSPPIALAQLRYSAGQVQIKSAYSDFR